MDRNKKPSN